MIVPMVMVTVVVTMVVIMMGMFFVQCHNPAPKARNELLDRFIKLPAAGRSSEKLRGDRARLI
jgi:uncharacterized membrane protein